MCDTTSSSPDMDYVIATLVGCEAVVDERIEAGISDVADGILQAVEREPSVRALKSELQETQRRIELARINFMESDKRLARLKRRLELEERRTSRQHRKKYRKCPAASQLSKENIDADHEDQENEDYHICKKVLLEGDQLPITNKPSAGTLDTSEQTTVTPTTITGMTDHESDENDDRHGCKKILPEDDQLPVADKPAAGTLDMSTVSEQTTDTPSTTAGMTDQESDDTGSDSDRCVLTDHEAAQVLLDLQILRIYS